jgi:L-fucose isomerase-like protein
MLATKIGFLPLSWDVWDVDGWGEKLRDRCVAAMEKIEGIELVVPPKALTKGGCVGEDLAEAEKALALFKQQDIQGLVIGNMNFGVELAVGTVLSGLRKDMPILHLSTRSAPYAKDGVRGTDTWCGSFMAAAAIYRRGFNYTHIHTCMPEDDYFSQKIDTFARAVCAISRFKGAKFAQIATRPRLFESQNYSEQALQKNFSQRIEYVDIDTLFGMMEDISPGSAEVKAVVDDIQSRVRVLEVAEDTLVNMARFELALKRIYHDYKVCALAPSCWTRLQERFHIAACATFGRLNDQGIITACEVDVLGAITMWRCTARAMVK